MAGYEWAVFADDSVNPRDGSFCKADSEKDAYRLAEVWRKIPGMSNVQVMRRPVAEWESADGVRDD